MKHTHHLSEGDFDGVWGVQGVGCAPLLTARIQPTMFHPLLCLRTVSPHPLPWLRAVCCGGGSHKETNVLENEDKERRGGGGRCWAGCCSTVYSHTIITRSSNQAVIMHADPPPCSRPPLFTPRSFWSGHLSVHYLPENHLTPCKASFVHRAPHCTPLLRPHSRRDGGHVPGRGREPG